MNFLQMIYFRIDKALFIQRRVVCIAGIILLNILWSMNVAAAQTVRVGYDRSGTYLYRDEQGEYRGYNVEYLYEMAKYTGWEYEFVPFGEWAAAVTALEHGDIDLLPTVLRSSEREGKMFFSMRRMGDTYVALVVRKDQDQYFYGDLEALQGSLIGVRQDTVDARSFFAWAEDYGLRYRLRQFRDQKDLLEALDAGSIDAAAMSYTGRARGYRAVAEFAPQEMYFAVTPGRRDLAQQLDTAMGQISIMNPEFLTKLTKKYLDTDTNSKPVFNKNELAFLASGNPVRITLLRNAFPFSYWIKDTGFQGIIPDLLEQFSFLTGLNFTFIPVDSQQEALDLIAKGEADVVGRIANNLFFAQANDLRLTTPYVFMNMVQITAKDKREIKRIAVQGSAQKDDIENHGGGDADREYIIYSDVEECFDALSKGLVDAIDCDSATASYFLNTHRASEYKVVALQGYAYDLAFGVSKAADPYLASILDKCIRYISAEDIAALLTQDRLPKSRSIRAFVEQLPGQYIVGFIVGLSFLVLFLAYASFTLWRKRGIEARMAAVKEKNRQMKTDLDTAQKINAVKEEFFTHISHDMRTPLNGILGFANLAAETTSPEAVREYIDKIKLSGELLLALVNDTLQLSKLERGNLQLTWEEADSMEFIEFVIAPMRLFAKEKGIDFIVDLSGWESERILIDRLNTHKVVLSILSNAIKFTPEGGKVYFYAESVKSSEGRFAAWLTVRDTGIGISKEFLPKVYEPFAQEQAGISNLPGNGMGLSVAQQLIHLLGGNIEIKSQLGKGAEVRMEFYFELAVKKKKYISEETLKTDFSRLAGKRVLLCEDNDLNMEIARTLLEQKEMQVICAKDGRQGVDIFAVSAPYEFQLILMDLHMPILDGYAAADAIRCLSREDAAEVPILALTADAYKEDIQKCLQHGMNAHVAKPIRIEQLFEEILRWV